MIPEVAVSKSQFKPTKSRKELSRDYVLVHSQPAPANSAFIGKNEEISNATLNESDENIAASTMAKTQRNVRKTFADADVLQDITNFQAQLKVNTNGNYSRSSSSQKLPAVCHWEFIEDFTPLPQHITPISTNQLNERRSTSEPLFKINHVQHKATNLKSHAHTWAKTWKRLKAVGWSWAYASRKLSQTACYHYVLPGKSHKNGVLGQDFFNDENSVLKYLRENAPEFLNNTPPINDVKENTNASRWMHGQNSTELDTQNCSNFSGIFHHVNTKTSMNSAASIKVSENIQCNENDTQLQQKSENKVHTTLVDLTNSPDIKENCILNQTHTTPPSISFKSRFDQPTLQFQSNELKTPKEASQKSKAGIHVKSRYLDMADSPVSKGKQGLTQANQNNNPLLKRCLDPTKSHDLQSSEKEIVKSHSNLDSITSKKIQHFLEIMVKNIPGQASVRKMEVLKSLLQLPDLQQREYFTDLGGFNVLSEWIAAALLELKGIDKHDSYHLALAIVRVMATLPIDLRRLQNAKAHPPGYTLKKLVEFCKEKNKLKYEDLIKQCKELRKKWKEIVKQETAKHPAQMTEDHNYSCNAAAKIQSNYNLKTNSTDEQLEEESFCGPCNNSSFSQNSVSKILKRKTAALMNHVENEKDWSELKELGKAQPKKKLMIEPQQNFGTLPGQLEHKATPVLSTSGLRFEAPAKIHTNLGCPVHQSGGLSVKESNDCLICKIYPPESLNKNQCTQQSNLEQQRGLKKQKRMDVLKHIKHTDTSLCSTSKVQPTTGSVLQHRHALPIVKGFEERLPRVFFAASPLLCSVRRIKPEYQYYFEDPTFNSWLDHLSQDSVLHSAQREKKNIKNILNQPQFSDDSDTEDRSSKASVYTKK